MMRVGAVGAWLVAVLLGLTGIAAVLVTAMSMGGGDLIVPVLAVAVLLLASAVALVRLGRRLWSQLPDSR